MWYMYTTEPHTHITFRETLRMVAGDRKPLDPVSSFACWRMVAESTVWLVMCAV